MELLPPEKGDGCCQLGKGAFLFKEKPASSQSHPIPIGQLGLPRPASLASPCHGHFTVSLVLRESVPRWADKKSRVPKEEKHVLEQDTLG